MYFVLLLRCFWCGKILWLAKGCLKLLSLISSSLFVDWRFIVLWNYFAIFPLLKPGLLSVSQWHLSGIYHWNCMMNSLPIHLNHDSHSTFFMRFFLSYGTTTYSYYSMYSFRQSLVFSSKYVLVRQYHNSLYHIFRVAIIVCSHCGIFYSLIIHCKLISMASLEAADVQCLLLNLNHYKEDILSWRKRKQKCDRQMPHDDDCDTGRPPGLLSDRVSLRWYFLRPSPWRRI